MSAAPAVPLRDLLPVWGEALVLAAIFVAACELGFRIGARRRVDEEVADMGHILSATLGLLALLVGFTFALALGRHESRRELVVTEANAIGTAWLRSALVPEPERAVLVDQLRRYADQRLALADASENGAAIARAEAATDSLHAALWATSVAAVPRMQPATVAPLLLAAMNDVIDVAGARRAALAARLPPSVLGALVLYALIAAGFLGYVTGAGARRPRLPAALLLLLLTLALALILDLDRPRTGTITISQRSLLELRAAMTSRP